MLTATQFQSSSGYTGIHKATYLPTMPSLASLGGRGGRLQRAYFMQAQDQYKTPLTIQPAPDSGRQLQHWSTC